MIIYLKCIKITFKNFKTFGFDISPVQFALPQVALNCHKHTETNMPNVTVTLVNLFNMCPNYKSLITNNDNIKICVSKILL